MKKTYITLLALAGVAAGDSLTPVASCTDYSFASSVITFANTDTAWSSFAGQINAATGFTLQITLTDWTPDNGPVFYLSTGDSATTALYDTSLVSVGYCQNGNGIASWYGASLFSNSGSMKTDTAQDGSVTYSYTSTSRTELPSHTNSTPLETTLFVTSSGGTVTLYEVDNDSELVQICSTTNLSEGEAQSIVFSEWARANGYHTTNSNSGTIGITAYSGVLTNAQMAALIPEPATATLSLLALAGLAARRRRR